MGTPIPCYRCYSVTLKYCLDICAIDVDVKFSLALN